MNFKKSTISVTGNIGSGKTTFITKLLQLLGPNILQVIAEPVETWQNLEGHNVLQAFYDDPRQNAYMFQTLAFTSRCIALTETEQHTPLRITERSPLSDRLFMLNLLEDGKLSEMEWAVYRSFYDFMTSKLRGMPDIIIYLRTDPVVCETRMKVRARAEESTVPLEYLQKLHQKHEEWLPAAEGGVTVNGRPYICIDGNADFRDDVEFMKCVAARLSALCGLKLIEFPSTPSKFVRVKSSPQMTHLLKAVNASTSTSTNSYQQPRRVISVGSSF